MHIRRKFRTFFTWQRNPGVTNLWNCTRGNCATRGTYWEPVEPINTDLFLHYSLYLIRVSLSCVELQTSGQRNLRKYIKNDLCILTDFNLHYSLLITFYIQASVITSLSLITRNILHFNCPRCLRLISEKSLICNLMCEGFVF